MTYLREIDHGSNKNAFQYDAYHPLVARIFQHALLPGEGVYLPSRGCTCPVEECTCLGGVYLPRGCTCLGVPAQVLPPVDRQTRVKTYPSQISSAGGNN